jgi:hypothetical protein
VVAQRLEQTDQLVVLAMDVADDVVIHGRNLRSARRRVEELIRDRNQRSADMDDAHLLTRNNVTGVVVEPETPMKGSRDLPRARMDGAPGRI